VYEYTPLEAITEKHFHRHFNINVLGLLLVTQAAVKYLREGGCIINIGSVATRITSPNSAVYSGTKAAVDAITIVLSRELGPKKIRVNTISPGIVETSGYYVGARSARTIMAFSIGLGATGEYVLPARIVPFPRGFAFGSDGRLFLASGIGPHGEGDNSIVAFAPTGPIQAFRLVTDPELSPLDLAIAPNGNIVVSSEYPFGASSAVTTVREHDALDGRLVRVFSPNR